MHIKVFKHQEIIPSEKNVLQTKTHQQKSSESQD